MSNDLLIYEKVKNIEEITLAIYKILEHEQKAQQKAQQKTPQKEEEEERELEEL